VLKRTTMLLLAALFALPAHAQDGQTVAYQGVLAGLGGAPVNGGRAITFRLYSLPDGGAALWEEPHPAVQISEGAFAVDLGSTNPFPDNLGAGALYLGLQVDGDAEMRPRLPVGASLRARWAAVAEHARDVRDEHIHPGAVSIGETPVIDEQGRWVGDPTGLQGPPGEAAPEVAGALFLVDDAGNRLGRCIACGASGGQVWRDDGYIVGVSCSFAERRCSYNATLRGPFHFQDENCDGSVYVREPSGILQHREGQTVSVGGGGRLWSFGPMIEGVRTMSRSDSEDGAGCANSPQTQSLYEMQAAGDLQLRPIVGWARVSP
jgi:hypothetical protein